jgi:hypothetical protein
MSRRLFRNRNRPRSHIDIRVGSHLLETLMQLRREDYDWYIDNEAVIEHELLELLEDSIVPRIFGNEIELYYKELHPHLFPPDQLGATTKGDIGSKNNMNTKGKKSAHSASKKIARKLTAAQKRKLEKQRQEEQGQQKDEKHVYFSFGELIQLGYRREPIASARGFFSQHTLLYEREKEGQFKHPPKLSDRLLIWISKVDPQNKTNPDPSGVGFYRPELIPITSLFREPKGDISEEE